MDAKAIHEAAEALSDSAFRLADMYLTPCFECPCLGIFNFPCHFLYHVSVIDGASRQEVLDKAGQIRPSPRGRTPIAQDEIRGERPNQAAPRWDPTRWAPADSPWRTTRLKQARRGAAEKSLPPRRRVAPMANLFNFRARSGMLRQRGSPSQTP